MILYAAMIDDPHEQTRFNALYEGYRGRMYVVAYRVLNDHGLAEDAVHDAFLGIAMSMKTVPDGDGPEVCAYLYTCAKNAALRILQKEYRQEQVYEQSTQILEVGPSAFDEVEQSDDYDRLVAAIRQLSPTYRDVLLMHYVYELSLDEIADRLFRKKKTVKQQLTRAKKLLADLYRKEDPANEAIVSL